MVSKNAPAIFIQKLWNILENEENGSICWKNGGLTFEIKDQQTYSEEILSLNFKHSNFSSFIRQLNMYNFRKIRENKQCQEFYHQLFRKGHKQLLIGIKRKPTQADVAFGKQLLKTYGLDQNPFQPDFSDTKEVISNHPFSQVKQIEIVGPVNPILFQAACIGPQTHFFWDGQNSSREKALENQSKTELYFTNLIYCPSPMLTPNIPVFMGPPESNARMMPIQDYQPMMFPVPIYSRAIGLVPSSVILQNPGSLSIPRPF